MREVCDTFQVCCTCLEVFGNKILAVGRSIELLGSLPLLTQNDTTNASILQWLGHPFLIARNTRFLKVIPDLSALISTPAHNMALFHAAHERIIAGFTFGWTTAHPSQIPTSTNLENATQSSNGNHIGHVTDEGDLHFWASAKIVTAFFRISLSSVRIRFSRNICFISASRIYPLRGNLFSGYSLERPTHR